MNLSHTSQIWLAIALCALVTYLIRIGGLLLADRLPETGKAARILEALPGTILISFIAPEVFANGIQGIIAAAVIVILMWRTKHVLLSAGIGLIVIMGLRMITG